MTILMMISVVALIVFPRARRITETAQSQSFPWECHGPDAVDPDLLNETLLTTFSHQCTQYRALR